MGFKYCGEHWRINDLPVRIRLASPPSGVVTPEELVSAAQAAAAAWNAVWPVSGLAQVNTQNLQLRCQGTVPGPALCVDLTVGASGPNTVGWGSVIGCDPAAAPCPGKTERATASGHITSVSVTLNSSLQWRTPLDVDAGVTPHQAALGEVRGVMGSFCPDWIAVCTPQWYDLQSVLTHEFGHVLGLDHPPAAIDWLQTMYFKIWPGDTHARTLHYGDVVGVQVVAADSATSVGGA